MTFKKIALSISIVLVVISAFSQELLKVTPVYRSYQKKSSGMSEVLFMSSYKGELYFASFTSLGPLVWKYNRINGKTEVLEESEGIGKSIFASVQTSDKYLYFSYDSALFCTDRIDAGIVKLSEGKFVEPYLAPYEGSSLIFFTREHREEKLTLNFSDGTKAGTRIIKVFDEECCKILWPIYTTGSRNKLYLSNGKNVFFVLMGDNSSSLWKTDGTSDGTLLLLSFPRNSIPTDFLISDGILYFTFGGIETEDNPGRLWKSDGTVAGTIKMDIDGTAFLGKAGNDVLYHKDGKIYKLKSQELITDFSADYNYFYDQEHVNNDVFLIARNESKRSILRSDGTPSGTFIVEDIDLRNCKILGSCHENIYFSCKSTTGSKILKMTDKSTAPEVIGEIQDSFPSSISCETEGLFFSAISDSVSYVYLLKNNSALNTEKSFLENKQELLVYPVPSSGSVKIETPVPGKLLISDISGKKVVEQHVEKSLYLENLETGLYFTELTIEGKVSRKVFSVIR